MLSAVVDTGADDWDFESGSPSLNLFANAIQVWSVLQGRPVTVHDAGLAFNATPDVIRQAVEHHYFMFLDGDTIEHDGE
jgi:hypothetical protein